MDATSYRQLRAYAAQYGAIVGLIWIVSFAFYIVGLTHPLIGNIGLLIGIFSVVAAGFLVEGKGRLSRGAVVPGDRHSEAVYHRRRGEDCGE